MENDKRVELVRRLSSKTIASELSWEKTPIDDRFMVSFRVYSVEIWQEDADMYVSIINSEGEVVEVFSDVDIKPALAESYSLLTELHAAARRQAMGIDVALNSILDELG